MSPFQNKAMLFLGCGLLAALLWIVAPRAAVAAPDADGNRDLVMVTGAFANGMEVLYVMDSRTKHLSVYRVDNGRSLKLVAARNCTYDFLLESFGDESASDMTPGMLRKHWTKYNAEASGSSSAPEKPETDKPPAGGR